MSAPGESRTNTDAGFKAAASALGYGSKKAKSIGQRAEGVESDSLYFALCSMR